MSAQPDLLRLQPKRFPIDRVKVDFRKLLSSMGQALTHGTFAFFAPEPATAAGSTVNAGAAIFGAVEAFEADAPLEVRSWYLVRSALATALGQLLGELHERRGPFEGDLEHIDNRFDLLLEGDGAVIDAKFLDNPRTLKLLPEIRRVLEDWLSAKVGLSAGDARSLALRLDTHLAPALRAESRAHRDYYKQLYDHFEDRFAYAAQMEWDWERNRLALVQQIDDPVFEETFSLRQVYVPLRAYTLEDIESDERSPDGRKRRCRIFMLEDEINSWLKHGPNAGDDIRLITGGPGSGKSTFAKWLAAELCEKHRTRVLFIPLQRFRIQASLKDAISTYLTETKLFQQNPLAQDGFGSPRDPLLIIFDGLDELTKPGDLADEQIKLFIEELRHHLGLWNDGGVKVLALITGRTVYAQAKRPLLRIADRQEVAVLPYLVDDNRRTELCGCHKVSGERLLKGDQREQWWRNYGIAKGLDETSLPEIFKNNRDLRELTADPLLNYLVVLSGFHKDLAGDAEINRNRIYARLLKDVLDRRHAKRAETDRVALAAVDDAKDRSNFEKLLETVALAAWHGDGRTTSRAEIEQLLPHELRPTWQELVTGGPGFTRLIAAFYIRQTEASVASDAVEFTHKSFGEYLTARRLVREISDLHQELQRAGRYKEDDALGDWARLTSAQTITTDLLRFFQDEIRLRPMRDVRAWQKTLTDLLNLELRTGFPLGALSPDGFRAAERQARNAEIALLSALSSTSRSAHQTAAIKWDHSNSAQELIRRVYYLVSQCGVTRDGTGAWRTSDKDLNDILSFVDYDSQAIIFRDLSNLNLDHCSFREGQLFMVNFSEASLVMASLSRAKLRCAECVETNFSRADLSGANLQSADLRRAYLIEANLAGANLTSADLRMAKFTEADLADADFTGADLAGANLHQAKNLTEDQIESAGNVADAQLPDCLSPKRPQPRARRRSRKPIPSPRR